MVKVGNVAEFFVCPECGLGVTYLKTGRDPVVQLAITGLFDLGTILIIQGEEFSAECCRVPMERRELGV